MVVKKLKVLCEFHWQSFWLTRLTKMLQWLHLNNSHAHPFCKTTPGTISESCQQSCAKELRQQFFRCRNCNWIFVSETWSKRSQNYSVSESEGAPPQPLQKTNNIWSMLSGAWRVRTRDILVSKCYRNLPRSPQLWPKLFYNVDPRSSRKKRRKIKKRRKKKNWKMRENRRKRKRNSRSRMLWQKISKLRQTTATAATNPEKNRGKRRRPKKLKSRSAKSSSKIWSITPTRAC